MRYLYAIPTVPPQRAMILTPAGGLTGAVLGPIVEGEPLRIVCRVEGGIPPPDVSWFINGTPVERSRNDTDIVVTTTVMQTHEAISNTLTLVPLRRRFLNSEVACSASNTNLTAPIQASSVVDMIRE